MSVGVPVKILKDAEGHIVTCEVKTGELYRGKLVEVEDSMNCQLNTVTATYPDGHSAEIQDVYIRGSQIVFVVLPDMFQNAPMFRPVTGRGRGRGSMLRAQAAHGRGGRWPLQEEGLNKKKKK